MQRGFEDCSTRSHHDFMKQNLTVFFQWMFFNSIKEINRLRKEINRRLFSKGMSNNYLKVTVETFPKLRFPGFKKFIPRTISFAELQFTQIEF